MKTKTIKQSVFFKATPENVYEALMDSKKHSKFTGSKARISNKVGGRFSAYEEGLTGKNIELIKNKKIVQEWQCKMQGWSEDYYSKATFSIKKEKNGTKLTFTQSGVPEVCYEDISKGWQEYYWKPMKKMLEK